MSVGVLLITHEGIGHSVLAVAQRLLGKLPLTVDVFELPFDSDVEAALPAASAAMRRVDQAEGVLILCDLYGSSPSNLAARLARLGTPAARVTGLNLCMLLRICNYADQPLDELARTAAGGARNGVIADDA